MNKKSQSPGDAIYVIIMLVILAIGGLVAYKAFGDVFTSLKANPVLNATPSAVEAFDAGSQLNDMWDYVILFVFIGLTIGLLIAGYFIDAHSVFFPIFIIGMIGGAVLSVILSYVWTQFSSSASIGLDLIATNNFPITDHLMNNLPIYFTIIAALSLVATYAKTRGE